MEAVFSGYFEHEQDVGDHEFLAECAEKTGVFSSAEEARTFLAGTELKDNVGKEIMEAVQIGESPSASVYDVLTGDRCIRGTVHHRGQQGESLAARIGRLRI